VNHQVKELLDLGLEAVRLFRRNVAHGVVPLGIVMLSSVAFALAPSAGHGRVGATDCHQDAGGPLAYVNRPLNGSGLQGNQVGCDRPHPDKSVAEGWAVTARAIVRQRG